jgi:gag-polypeptide of LTR copia-type
MSAIPSLTILSEDQKFNGDNLLQWKNNITQLLGAKGLMGYVDGKIPKPTQSPTISDSDTPPPATATVTPIYSTTPTLDEWNFRDQLARGHITLNCTDVAGLGVVITGTAKEAWDSIQNEWGKSTDMRRSHAQEALNQTVFAEGTDIQEHIKLLRTRKMAVDNLCTSPMGDETWRGVIIRSIPPTARWLPVIPSLYALSSSPDVISTLLAHGMILSRETGGSGTWTNPSPSNISLAARTTEGCTNSNCNASHQSTHTDGCTNPNCKASNRSTHTTENCYWPGGGKEGQFPPNFGQRSRANIVASSESPSLQTQHFVLSARATDTPGQSGILIDDDELDASSVGEQAPTSLDTLSDTNKFTLEYDSDFIITNCTRDTNLNPHVTTPFTNLLLANINSDIVNISINDSDPDINDDHHIDQVTVQADQRLGDIGTSTLSVNRNHPARDLAITDHHHSDADRDNAPIIPVITIERHQSAGMLPNSQTTRKLDYTEYQQRKETYDTGAHDSKRPQASTIATDHTGNYVVEFVRTIFGTMKRGHGWHETLTSTTPYAQIVNTYTDDVFRCTPNSYKEVMIPTENKDHEFLGVWEIKDVGETNRQFTLRNGDNTYIGNMFPLPIS